MSRRTPIRLRTLPGLAAAAALLLACQDAPGPTVPEFSAADQPQAPAMAALDAGSAALLSVVLEDALGRLVPAAGPDSAPLRSALTGLMASLAYADAETLGGHVDHVREQLADESLEPSDADAVRLALDELVRVIGRAGMLDEAAR